MSGWIKVIISGVTVIASAVGVYLYGENAEKKGEATGEARAKAAYADKLDTLKLKVARLLGELSQREEFILTGYALGLCCLKANHLNTPANITLLDDLVVGIGSRSRLSQHTQLRIAEMIVSPPNLSTIWLMIAEYQLNDPKTLSTLEELVTMLMQLDETKPQEARDFMTSWYELVAA